MFIRKTSIRLLTCMLSLYTSNGFTQATIPDSIERKSIDQNKELDEVVISGTLKEVSKSNSSVPIEVYSASFFRTNPTSCLFDGLANINGVKPQSNCNICNTGDIHINGLEGSYTMLLIDGMPIVSGLSTVYGLSGIPQSMIDRIEVVKGPASTLYGSEAVGGLINVITKSPTKSPLFSFDLFGTSWGEINLDLATKLKVGKKAQALLGINTFFYNTPKDNNNDNFTDLTLQNRVSIFNKWNFQRKDNRLFSMAGRYVYEDRWGGEMNWKKENRGGNDVYGESIYTSRWELFGTYQLPIKEKVLFQFSSNGHQQNSVYGNMRYNASQNVLFAQLLGYKKIGKHDILTGLTYRFTRYDDNSPATANENNLQVNQPHYIHLPGFFTQDEIFINTKNTLLIGARYDYNSLHGSIVTPRINYKWNSTNQQNILRLSIGNGYRVANVFTEDHAALTGARKVIFNNALKPEKSWNANINFVKLIPIKNTKLILDATIFYTYFSNKIIPDYETNPNQIIYDNLSGYATSKGISLNIDYSLPFGLKFLVGATTMDVSNTHQGTNTRQLFTERFTATWTISYTVKKIGMRIDYTGNVYSPMRLPLLSDLDPRPEYSPWWSIQNIQVTQMIKQKWEVYAGIKNILNWTPNKSIPFLIARPNDPFDTTVIYENNGQVMPTTTNPYALTFDPSYMYAPNQGIRFFLGVRYSI